VKARCTLPALLLVACLASCGGDSAATQPTTPPSPTTTNTLSNGAPGNVIEVLDGDTLRVSIDGREEEVRLLGVNAPERDECYSVSATAALTGLTRSGRVTVDAAGGRDGFGRLLAYVYFDGTLVNLALVEKGAAIAIHTDHPLLEEFLDAEQDAFAAATGLWASAVCGPTGTTKMAIVSVNANPEGPDEDNLNEEYVTLANTGAAAADLSGWTVRDESSQHRYGFPSGTRVAPGAQVRVHTGCGADDTNDLYWCAEGPVWNNAGDTVLLLDPSGNVADRYRYSG
jgi:micrococcal nuclease